MLRLETHVRIWSLLATVLAIGLALSACGGGGDDDDAGDDSDDGDETPAGLTDNELAEAMLLILEDFPDQDRWTYTAPTDDPDEPNPLDDCDPGEPEGLTGEADGGDFEPEDIFGEITQDIRIFEEHDQVVTAIERFPDVGECAEEVVNDGDLDTEDATYSDFEFSELDFPEFGDFSRAYRITMTATSTDPEDDPQTAAIYIDQVVVAVGNIGVRIQASAAFDPFPPAGVAEIIQLALDKIEAVLDEGVEPTGEEETDDATRTPRETSEEETEPPDETDEPSGEGASQGNPVPLGDAAVLLDRARVRILEVNFDAEDIVLAEDPSNEAASGKDMVLIAIEVTNEGDEELDVFFDLYYNLIGEKGIEYDEFDPSCGTVPNELEGILAAGEKTMGNICVQADDDDSDLVFLLQMFDDDFDQVPLYMALD
jgi:hypothetical protein